MVDWAPYRNVQFRICAITNRARYHRLLRHGESVEGLLVDIYEHPELAREAWRGQAYRPVEFAMMSNGRDLLGGHFWEDDLLAVTGTWNILVEQYLVTGVGEANIGEPYRVCLRRIPSGAAILSFEDSSLGRFVVDPNSFLHDIVLECMRLDVWMQRWLGHRLYPSSFCDFSDPSRDVSVPSSFDVLLARVEALP